MRKQVEKSNELKSIEHYKSGKKLFLKNQIYLQFYFYFLLQTYNKCNLSIIFGMCIIFYILFLNVDIIFYRNHILINFEIITYTPC